MTVQYAKSTDAGAPVLTGQAASLIALLDACLIDGFGTYTPPDGWEKQFAAGNVACYRSTHAPSHACALRVDASSNHAKVRGYGSMSDVDTGTDPFPTAAQFADGLIWTTSSTTDATARPWHLVADERTLHLFVRWSSSTQFDHYQFGDLNSLDPADTTNTVLEGAESATRTWPHTQHEAIYETISFGISVPSAHRGIWVRAPHAGGDPIRLGRVGMGNGAQFGRYGVAYPSPVGGGLTLLASQLKEDAYTVRGAERGFYLPFHPFALGASTFASVAALNGASAISVPTGWEGSSNTRSECVVQTSGEW